MVVELGSVVWFIDGIDVLLVIGFCGVVSCIGELWVGVVFIGGDVYENVGSWMRICDL